MSRYRHNADRSLLEDRKHTGGYSASQRTYSLQGQRPTRFVPGYQDNDRSEDVQGSVGRPPATLARGHDLGVSRRQGTHASRYVEEGPRASPTVEAVPRSPDHGFRKMERLLDPDDDSVDSAADAFRMRFDAAMKTGEDLDNVVKIVLKGPRREYRVYQRELWAGFHALHSRTWGNWGGDLLGLVTECLQDTYERGLVGMREGGFHTVLPVKDASCGPDLMAMCAATKVLCTTEEVRPYTWARAQMTLWGSLCDQEVGYEFLDRLAGSRITQLPGLMDELIDLRCRICHRSEISVGAEGGKGIKRKGQRCNGLGSLRDSRGIAKCRCHTNIVSEQDVHDLGRVVSGVMEILERYDFMRRVDAVFTKIRMVALLLKHMAERKHSKGSRKRGRVE